MVGYQIGDLTVGGASAVGRVTGLRLRQTSMFDVHADWDYEGFSTDAITNIKFLVYLDGELVQRLPGTARQTDIKTIPAGTTDLHDVDVVAWPANMITLAEWYGNAATLRAHLTWTRSAQTDLASYSIYHSTDGTTFVAYASHATPSLQGGMFALAGGATCEISGGYTGSEHTNTAFTLTVTDGTTGACTLTNNQDSESVALYLVNGASVPLFGGVQATANGTVATGDTLTFYVGIAPEYNTAALAAGTHYFKVSSADSAGNESAQSSAVSVVITPPPAPIINAALTCNGTTITLTGTQSATGDAVAVYSNYDPDTNTLQASIIDTVPLVSASVAAGAAISISLLTISGVPAGTVLFVARSVASGIEDSTGVELRYALPYVPASLPAVARVEAVPAAACSVVLTWYADAASEFGWQITVGAYAAIVTADPAHYDSRYFVFTATLDGTTVFADVEGTYTITVRSVDEHATYYGTSASVSVTTDKTAPDVPAGIIATAF